MSNKTQLQTNNANLDALITRVNAAKDVAASLPDAGGGGGSNIDTCTVTLGSDAPLYGEEMAWYVDGSFALRVAGIPDFGDRVQITVIKNTIMCTNCYLTPSEKICLISDDNPPMYAYFVSGEGNLVYG